MKTKDTGGMPPLKATQSIGAAMKTANTVRTLTRAKNQGAVSQQKGLTQKTRSTSPAPMTWEDKARAAQVAQAKQEEKEKLKKQLKEAFASLGKAARGALSSADDLTQ